MKKPKHTMKSLLARVANRELDCAAISVEPMPVDWSAGYGERWELVRPDFAGWENADLVTWLQSEGREVPEPDRLITDIDDEAYPFARDEYHEALVETAREQWDESDRGPMMNFAYYLPDMEDAEEAVRKLELARVPLCMVSLDDAYYLALTGGGMDLSWEICKAYIAVGYWPPVHFDLPRMGSEGDLDVIACCLKSRAIAIRWATDSSARLVALAQATGK